MNYFVFIDILQNSFTNFVGIMSKKTYFETNGLI